MHSFSQQETAFLQVGWPHLPPRRHAFHLLWRDQQLHRGVVFWLIWEWPTVLRQSTALQGAGYVFHAKAARIRQVGQCDRHR